MLVAAAVVLIPEMLSGPKRGDDASAKRNGDEPFKTYTIDLNRSPGASTASTPTTTPVDERAPPPESEAQQTTNEPTQASAPDSETPAEERAQTAQASPESAQPEPAPPPQRVAERQPEPQPRPREHSAASTRETTTPAPVASAPTVPTSRGWAVQLGSFASKATAERMAKEFSSSGQAAFVMPVKSGANTLYRVRVGPFAERAAANDALVAIKRRVANAAVVAHP